MREVVQRRYRKVLEHGGPFPDLILIDGGKGQLGAAMEVARDLGVEIPTIGLAKQFEEVFLPGRRDPLLLSRRSPDRGSQSRW